MTEQAANKTYEYIGIDESLVLRAVLPDEAADLFRITDENKEYLGKYLPWVSMTKTVDDSKSFLESVNRERGLGEAYGYGIYYKNNLVGHISLMHISDSKEPEIGYWISEDASGKGIVTKAADAVTYLGLVTLGLPSIVIKARTDNIGSNKVAEKIGYTLEETREEQKEELNIWRKK